MNLTDLGENAFGNFPYLSMTTRVGGVLCGVVFPSYDARYLVRGHLSTMHVTMPRVLLIGDQSHLCIVSFFPDEGIPPLCSLSLLFDCR